MGRRSTPLLSPPTAVSSKLSVKFPDSPQEVIAAALTSVAVRVYEPLTIVVTKVVGLGADELKSTNDGKPKIGVCRSDLVVRARANGSDPVIVGYVPVQ